MAAQNSFGSKRIEEMNKSTRNVLSTRYASSDKLKDKQKATDGRDFETPKVKKMRLNPPTRLLDVGDEPLCCILMNLFGCKSVEVLRPRVLQNMISAYEFIHTNNHMIRIFRNFICKQVRVIDTNFPSLIDEDSRTVPAFQHPMNMYFLSKMIGDSLRVLSLPCFLTGTEPTNQYRKYWTLNGQYMMLNIAKFCTKLEAITLQDSGIMKHTISEYFLSSNPRLKKIVAHSPTPAFLSALTQSNCALESLMLLHVEENALGPILKFLQEKGASLDSLSIETSPPFTYMDTPTAVSRVRYRRMVKRFMMRFEKIAREKLESLSEVVLQPFRESQWYREFILRFQRIGRARLITGSSSDALIYPPVTNGEVPHAMYKMLPLDYISKCETEDEFRSFLRRVELPDSLFIEGINFFFRFIDRYPTKVSTFVSTAIREKGLDVKTLKLSCAVYSSDVFNDFLDGMEEILDNFEESFGNLNQLKRLDIPIDLIPYMVEDRGYNRFLKRLSNLKEIFLSRPLPYMYLDIETPKAIPAFLKRLMKACCKLKCLYIASGHDTNIRSDVCVRDLTRAKHDACIALDEFEEENPWVDVDTIRRQVMFWSVSAA